VAGVQERIPADRTSRNATLRLLHGSEFGDVDEAEKVVVHVEVHGVVPAALFEAEEVVVWTTPDLVLGEAT